VEPTPARTFDEVHATQGMLECTRARFGLTPKRLAADTAYGTGKFLGWLVEQQIAPHIPVWGTRARARTAPSAGLTSPSARSGTSTPALPASC
jgi:hypothetical protein